MAALSVTAAASGAGELPGISWAWAGRSLDGGDGGDLHLVLPTARGALVAVIDALGHGPEAAATARLAAPLLTAHRAEPLPLVIQRCHEGLHHSRGAVMSLAVVDVRMASLTWTGVGNVDALLLRAPAQPPRANEAVPSRGGVVGYQLPPLREAVTQLFPGDTLVMVTDGIGSGFAAGLDLACTAQETAESILARHGKRNDDALALVLRYQGP